ncbi:MAG: signal peptide peptidase SppA [Desulfobacteraceae bacterium]|jgi:protease-4
MKRIIAVALLLLLTGCFPTTVRMFSNGTDPLKEFTVEGKGKNKILIISIQGVVNDKAEEGMFKNKPGLVAETLAQLKKAQFDNDVKALVIKVDSPGGTVTASDILYNEIKRFKEIRGVPVVVSFMNVGASGAYYLALSADKIIAHPTSIVGSVGVVFMRPKVYGLMDKIGLKMEVNTSGPEKDIGSPFKAATEEERVYFQKMITTMADRFYSLVQAHRKLSPEAFETIKKAGVFMPEEAQKLGLIDGIAYLPESINLAAKMAGIDGYYSVVTYRRDQFPDDTIYNNAAAELTGGSPLKITVPGLSSMSAGFYYLSPLFFNGE